MSSRGAPPSYVAALGFFAVHSYNTVCCVFVLLGWVKSGVTVLFFESVHV